jgi:hypothetical protein
MTDVRHELRETLNAVEAAVARGADAAQICGLLYDGQAVIVGEGNPAATRGVAAFVPQLADLLDGWGGGTRLTFELVEPVLISESIATGFLDVKCYPGNQPATVQHYRVLSAWQHGARGWRVALEMFATGSL